MLRPLLDLKEFIDNENSRNRIHGFTLEKVDLLFPVVMRSRQGKSCVHVIRNFVKANTNISRIIIIQHTVVKPPVLVSLNKHFQINSSTCLWKSQMCQTGVVLCPHLEDVGLPLTVDAGKGCINGPADAPHIFY